jgi:hypothetical protein
LHLRANQIAKIPETDLNRDGQDKKRLGSAQFVFVFILSIPVNFSKKLFEKSLKAPKGRNKLTCGNATEERLGLLH